MVEVRKLKGRPGRFAKFDELEASLPAVSNRAKYHDGIGLYRGAKAYTVWVKINFPRGGIFRGETIPVGGSKEIKLGKRASWDWPTLTAERDRLQGLADRGEPLEAAEVPIFSKYAADWLERKKTTHKSYALNKGHVESALNPTFGKKALNAITVGDVNRWIGQQSAGRKPSTVLRKLAVFKKIMNDAVREGLIEKSPASQADKIRGIEARQRIVTDEELTIILDTADKIEKEQENNAERTPQQIRGWLRLFIIFAFSSGMRRAEILGLTWDKVRKIDEKTTNVEVVNTKSGVSRTVTCTEGMTSVIAALRKLERANGDNRLFPVSMTTLKRSLTRLWKKTGLADVRLHDLRRTHATILISANVDPRTVSGRLGHSSTAMLKVYSAYRGDVGAAMAFDQTTSKKTIFDTDEETAGADEGMAEPTPV